MASYVAWVWPVSLNTPSCVRADGGGEPFPALLGLVTGGPLLLLSSSCLVPLFTEPFCHPHPGVGRLQKDSSDSLILGVQPR